MAITIRQQLDDGVPPATDTLTLTATLAEVGDTIVAISANDFFTLATLFNPTGTAVASWGSPDFSLDGGTDDGHAKVWVRTVTTAGGTVIFDWTNTDEERYGGIWVLAGDIDFDTAAGTDDDVGSTSHVAPSVTPTAGKTDDLLICLFSNANGLGSGLVNYTMPGGAMTAGTERDVDTFCTYRAGWEQLTSDAATGTRTATVGSVHNYLTLSVLVKTTAAPPALVWPRPVQYPIPVR